MPMKNSNNIIGNQTRDLPACSAVPAEYNILSSYVGHAISTITAGSSIDVVNIILLDGENISFEASLVMYTNSTNIPPIIIMNRMYGNHYLLYTVPLMRRTIVVCINSIIPMAIGCSICQSNTHQL